ncbi:MAG TPA: isoprenyl transferase [Candidatus Acetothermia bacterium]|nr:isoprenyl transferase [Candidatus Acetothermia bacterium]
MEKDSLLQNNIATLIELIRERGLPKHVAIIMDGNGRWASKRDLPRTAGHQAGVQTAERIIRFAGRELGLRHLTLYAFSTENWARPATEINFIMDLLDKFITEKLAEFEREGVRVIVSGDPTPLPNNLQQRVRDAIEQTAKNSRLVLNIALNYGARQEIVRACRMIAERVASGEVDSAKIDEQTIASSLYTAQIPDPDLIIRTSGEMRLSNFLLWQAAYTELHFTDTLWPDFGPDELVRAIAQYQDRERRYGAVKEAE